MPVQGGSRKVSSRERTDITAAEEGIATQWMGQFLRMTPGYDRKIVPGVFYILFPPCCHLFIFNGKHLSQGRCGIAHSSCGTMVEQIVKMAAGYEARDIELYTKSFQSIIAEFPPI